MMMTEFQNEYNRIVTNEQYDEIESAYYGYTGDKYQFAATMNLMDSDPKMLEQFLQTCFKCDTGNYKDKVYTVAGYNDDGCFLAHKTFGFEIAAKIYCSMLNEQYSDFVFHVSGN